MAGDILYLTKPIGVGMITTALKRGQAQSEDIDVAVKIMSQLNTLGQHLGTLNYVTALTDVTGFGLLGHLAEVCEGSNVSAEIDYSKVPLVNNVSRYAAQMIYPDNTMRNWSSYQHKVTGIGSESFLTLCDPQTSGGLLICVREDARNDFESFARSHGHELSPFGQLKEKSDYWITVVQAK
jgi:selenide,water dikinase